MYGTTFPKPDNFDDNDYRGNNHNQGGFSNNQGGGNNTGGFEKKPWNNNQQGNQRQGNGGGGNWGNRGGGNQGGGGGGNWGNKSGGFQRKPETDFSLYLPYAATGNQNPPPEVLSRIESVVRRLNQLGFTARTGGFEGVEETVEKAAAKKEVHLPWRGFNDKESKFTWTKERATSVARMFQPGFDALKKPVQTFLAKNARLILGDSMASPALFLIVWTEDGCNTSKRRNAQTGFSGHPIAIASALGIPIYNFQNPDDERRLNEYLDHLVLPEQGEQA